LLYSSRAESQPDQTFTTKFVYAGLFFRLRRWKLPKVMIRASKKVVGAKATLRARAIRRTREAFRQQGVGELVNDERGGLVVDLLKAVDGCAWTLLMDEAAKSVALLKEDEAKGGQGDKRPKTVQNGPPA